MRKIGISIPTFNRYKMTIDSFSSVIDDDRIESVTIIDDCSTDGSCEKLVEYFKDNSKVRILRNKKNEDCYRCKCISIKHSPMEWNILLDSDNKIDASYLDALYAIPEWHNNTIYQPEYAAPYFIFKAWSGLTLTKGNVAQYANTDLMTAMNAMNFFINREQYLKAWDGSVNPGSSDSLYFSFRWLESGNKIFVTPNLEYIHYISEKGDGHYQLNSSKFVKFHEQVMQRIKQLR